MSLLQFLLKNEPSFRESRLPSLYSDLTTLRNTNPEGYAANSQAWASALILLALSGDLPAEQRVILSTSDSLLNALASPRYGRPIGLGAVLDDAVRDRKMIDVSEFQKADKSIYNRSWIPSPWSVLSWSLRTAGLLSSDHYNTKSGDLRPGQLVLLPVLETVAKKIQAWQSTRPQSLTDRVFTHEAFATELSHILSPNTPNPPPLTPLDLTTLLTYLTRDRPILSHNATAIKLAPPTSLWPEAITAEDTAIANLKSLITTLTDQCTTLSTTITTQQTRASQALASKNRTLALTALRSKKSAEHTLSQRAATLTQLEEVLARIDDAASQVEVVDTLKSSAAALKSLNKKVGSVESIDEVMDQLREEMGKTAEMQDVLAEPLAGGDAVVQEMDVDEELEAMEREERERAEEQKAKETAARLAELGGGQKVPLVEDEERGKDTTQKEIIGQKRKQDLEKELSSSVEKLQGLKLDGNANREDEREEKTRVPETAS